MLGALLGILGGGISAFAVSAGSFWLLCFGTLLAGTYNAFGQQYSFAAAYAMLSVFAVVALAIASGLRITDMGAVAQVGSGRPWPAIARQPAFVVAVLAAALGYGTMNLLAIPGVALVALAGRQ